MVVQQHILNWLYSVLTSEYHDVNRTYNDVAQVLSQYPTLSPRTDVHTFPNGVSALLLHLTGTIPVVFRGNTYRFPISLWVPHAYPREPPLVYVTPTENMVVRPGQHVDPQGQVYHPYLVGWSSFWDKSTVLDFLAILRDVFAKEPPVVAKQQQPAHQQRQQAVSTPTPPPVPPLPNSNIMARPASVASSTHIASPPPNEQRPPPPPPKGNDAPVHRPSPVSAQLSSSGPPLPPHPGRQEVPAPHGHRFSRYDSAPPLPPQQPQHTGPTPPRPQYQSPPPGHVHTQYEQQHPSGYDNYQASDPTRMSIQSQAASSQSTPQPHGSWNQQHQQPPPHQQLPPQQPLPPIQQHAQQQAPHPQSQPPHTQYQHPPQPQPPTHQAPPQPVQPPTHQAPPQPVQPPPPPPPPPPPADIMNEPLVLSLPSPTNIPAPPIPPNPERSNLLAQLATTLHAMRVRARTQNESSLSGLQAQRAAMMAALSSMHAEQQSLSAVSSLLSSNASILHDSLRKADSVVADAKAGKIQPPDVDELLVAPTVVANQLYDLVAEERALADAVFVLGRAVERGRVSPAVFAKTTRSLAREWYLKKALVKKIGRGMGLIQP